MSLRTQLWIAVALIMLMSALVSITVSTVSAQRYLAQQLHLKNVDNAASLALSLTQLSKEDARIELAITAQFDTGHYRLIRLTNPRGEVMVERSSPVEPEGVPGWFLRLMAFEVDPGVAHVSDGWSQFGRLQVESQTSYAYESLWQGSRWLALIFAGGAVLIGVIGSLFLNRCVRPLQDVVRQAEAVGQRRFITIVEPNTFEFRAVANAMNRLSRHVKNMLHAESNRLQQLQERLHHDAVTGLLSREQLTAQFRVILAADNEGATGTMTLLRIQRLPDLNRELGRERLDVLLGRLGGALRAVAQENEFGLAGRLNGSDLVLIASGVNDLASVAKTLIGRIPDALGEEEAGLIRIDFGATVYLPREEPGAVLARADSALARAELGPGFRAEVEPRDGPWGHRTQAQWRTAIREALQNFGLQLAGFPVVDGSGVLIHTEAPMRLFMDGALRPAAYFLPWAVRLKLIRELDDAVLNRAFERLAQPGHPLAINLSTDSLLDTGFRQGLYRSLNEQPAAAPRLWLEFPARGALANLAELREVCRSVAHTGCKVGIEHAGAEAFNLQAMNDLGLHYVKIDGAIVEGIHRSPETQGLVRGLCTVAHSIGVLIIAENCHDPADFATLADLGVDGMTGPAVGAGHD
jgi:EAL domain-containing protein (putative c-di-GMP-specific phosphodiesterase class I)/GGDEF domain-containing protein